VLKPGAVLLAWDLAPPSGRFAWWQRFWLRGHPGRIATEKSLMSLAERSGFAVTREAHLRPFFAPPVPRASFVASTLPPGWRQEGANLIPPDAGEVGSAGDDVGSEMRETGSETHAPPET
jgi:hypothetical protein